MNANEKFLNFIEFYKNCEELWNSKCEKYKNKFARRNGYEKLLAEYKNVEEGATMDKMKKKINNMRTAYRRELKKVRDSEKSGAGEEDIYIPSLWYFDHMEFLQDQETIMPGLSSMDLVDYDDETNESVILPKSKRKRTEESAKTEFLRRATEHLDGKKYEKRDEASIFAEGWACALRKMTTEQQLYAKQSVDEIMIMGQLNRLHLNYLQNMSTSSSPYSIRTSTPHMIPTPLVSPANGSSIQILPHNQRATNIVYHYENVNDLFADEQYQ